MKGIYFVTKIHGEPVGYSVNEKAQKWCPRVSYIHIESYYTKSSRGGYQDLIANQITSNKVKLYWKY